MALPKAVQQQLEEADRLVATINGDKTGEDSSETNPENQEKDLLVNVERQENPPENFVPPNNTVSQENVQTDVPDEKWAHKYHTLKGMYDAEVPRLHSQLREMQAQIQQIIAEKATLEATKAAEKPRAESLITDEDKEAFGPDLIDLIERATDSKVATLRDREAELLSKISKLEGQLGNVEERQVISDKDRFLATLTQQVPDWEVLNTNSGFLGWLQEVDAVYGIPKHVALTNAYENGDVARVATIFNAYKGMLKPNAQPQARSNQQELQRQVAPTRTRSGTPPTNSESEQYFTNQDIEQFYNDWRRGVYDDAEAAIMEKQIHAAAAEGRIR
jgi:hypothetical protein